MISDFVFEIQHLVSGKTENAHGSRLKLFRNADFNVTTDCLENIKFQDGEYSVIQKLLDVRSGLSGIEVQVLWKGFDSEEPTWESADVLIENVPALMIDFINDLISSCSKSKKQPAIRLKSTTS